MTLRHLLSATTAVALCFGAAGALAASSDTKTTTTTTNTAATGAATAGAETTGELKTGRVSEACMEDLNQVEKDMNETGGMIPGRNLRSLHEAATIFAQAGMDEACQSVVEGIRDYGEQRAEAGSMDDDERAAYAERLENAKPLSEVNSRFRVGSLIGDEVVGSDGDEIGDIDDVMISADGSARYALIGTGGFIGIGEEYVPVEIGRLRMVDEDTLALSVTAETFEQAPRVETDRIDDTLESWAQDVDTWWAEHVAVN